MTTGRNSDTVSKMSQLTRPSSRRFSCQLFSPFVLVHVFARFHTGTSSRTKVPEVAFLPHALSPATLIPRSPGSPPYFISCTSFQVPSPLLGC